MDRNTPHDDDRLVGSRDKDVRRYRGLGIHFRISIEVCHCFHPFVYTLVTDHIFPYSSQGLSRKVDHPPPLPSCYHLDLKITRSLAEMLRLTILQCHASRPDKMAKVPNPCPNAAKCRPNAGTMMSVSLSTGNRTNQQESSMCAYTGMRSRRHCTVVVARQKIPGSTRNSLWLLRGRAGAVLDMLGKQIKRKVLFFVTILEAVIAFISALGGLSTRRQSAPWKP